jgi:leader peptidase (prepilin peptidase)/N-methyltransferase
VNFWLALPLVVRLAGIFAGGLAVGGAINWAIYSLAWFSRPISPWGPTPPHSDRRSFADLIPVWGWWRLRREASLHGAWFWVRPLVIELSFAAGIAALYWWEVEQLGLAVVPTPAATLHWQWLAHSLLFALLTAATFIDFDEKTIPDAITLPGTLLALTLAAMVPQSQLPITEMNGVGGLVPDHLLVTSPHPFPAWLHSWQGPAIGTLIVLAWCAALVPATSTMRRGLAKAVQFYVVSIVRRSSWLPLLAVAVIVSAVVWGVWFIGDARWEALFTALVGLAFGGAMVWGVRLVGTLAMREEAMGFGDVTLMAMIGAFLGWQPALMTFFYSPAAAVLVAVGQWLLTGRREIAFGPYLCVAAVYTIVRWAAIWNAGSQVFALGWMILAILAACLLLMMGLLMMMRLIRQAVSGEA